MAGWFDDPDNYAATRARGVNVPRVANAGQNTGFLSAILRMLSGGDIPPAPVGPQKTRLQREAEIAAGVNHGSYVAGPKNPDYRDIPMPDAGYNAYAGGPSRPYNGPSGFVGHTVPKASVMPVPVKQVSPAASAPSAPGGYVPPGARNAMPHFTDSVTVVGHAPRAATRPTGAFAGNAQDSVVGGFPTLESMGGAGEYGGINPNAYDEYEGTGGSSYDQSDASPMMLERLDEGRALPYMDMDTLGGMSTPAHRGRMSSVMHAIGNALKPR